MKAILGRLRKLEVRLVSQENEQGETPVQLILERRSRFLAIERGVPYEEALRETLMEHQIGHREFVANYRGNGSIPDILRYLRRCRLEAGGTEFVKAIR